MEHTVRCTGYVKILTEYSQKKKTHTDHVWKYSRIQNNKKKPDGCYICPVPCLLRDLKYTFRSLVELGITKTIKWHYYVPEASL